MIFELFLNIVSIVWEYFGYDIKNNVINILFKE
jgi:hypothetical protein